MYGVCPMMYEYKFPSMVRFIIRLYTIVRVSKYTQSPPVNVNTIWMYFIEEPRTG